MVHPSTLDHRTAPPAAPAPSPGAPLLPPLTAPVLPSLAPMLAPPGGPTAGLPAPVARSIVATPDAAPMLAPLLPHAAPTLAAARVTLPESPIAAVEPARLASALDAVGAPSVPPAQTVAGRRAAELRAARRKRSQRLRLGVVLILMAAGAFAGPALVRWVADQVQGGTEPLAPEAPTTVDVDTAAG